MSARLKQLELSYNPKQDRALLKLHMNDLSVYKMWLTRRYVKLLYPILQKMLSSDQAKSQIERQEEAQQVEKAFAKEQEMRKAGKQVETPKRFGTIISKEPLGPHPFLLTKIEVKPHEGVLGILCLYPEEGPGFEIGLDSMITQSLCKLLSEVEKKASWGLDL